jgi:hypothetical protein
MSRLRWSWRAKPLFISCPKTQSLAKVNLSMCQSSLHRRPTTLVWTHETCGVSLPSVSARVGEVNRVA